MSAQPTLPPEGEFSDVEAAFIEESPYGLWPENQDSNFGIFRKVVCDWLQQAADQMVTIYNERFLQTAEQWLRYYEEQYELMRGDNLPLAARRELILARKKKGPFTRAMRRRIVEAHIRATFGPPVQLTPEGVGLSPGGIPLYIETQDVATLVSIFERITNFSYEVVLDPTLALNMAALLRDLNRITPAHISYTARNASALANGSFEGSLASWTTADTAPVHSTTNPRHGTGRMESTATNAVHTALSEQIDIPAGNPDLSVWGWFWKFDGTGMPSTRLRITFYSAAGGQLGTVEPTVPLAGMNPATAAFDPSSVGWSKWGGRIPNSLFPAGATKAQVRINPKVGGTARVAVDAVDIAWGTPV